jgi:transposase
MSRGDLTDAQWRRKEPLLPEHRPAKGSKGGRPAEDHRRITNGMLRIDRTGAPWRALPTRYGPWAAVASRFYRWTKSGLWERILHALQAQADARGELDWDAHYVDGTVIRAHQLPAGAIGGTQSVRR